MTERIVENMSMEEAFKALNDASANVQVLNEALYKDTSGIMGELDAIYSSEDLQKAWEEGKDSDPSMLEYDDFDNWLEDTLSNMSQIFDDEEFDQRALEEEINSYSYKNYTICHGCHSTDRWYVKDGNDAFVGTKSGYSNEDEALKYVDSLNESFDDGKYCIVAITKDGDRKFYKDGYFIDSCKECTVFTDLDEAREIWAELDKSEFKRVFVPNWSEDMFAEATEEVIDEDTQTSNAVKLGIDTVISNTTEILNEASAIMLSGFVEYFDKYKNELETLDKYDVIEALQNFSDYVNVTFIDQIASFKKQLINHNN